MKISSETIDILKNFSGINQSILFREGNILRTISPLKNIMAKAVVTENIPQECAVYNLNQFINVIELLGDDSAKVDLEFQKSNFLIQQNDVRVKYFYASPQVIVSAPDKDLEMPSEDITFSLSQSLIQSVLKASLVMGLQYISVRSDGETLSLVAHDNNSGSSNEYSVKLENTSVKPCSVDFKSENFKLIPDDYKVTISSSKISEFEGSAITYWIAPEASSDFGS